MDKPNSQAIFYKKTLALALPILIAYVIGSLIPFINTLMAARISPQALAAMALTSTLYLFLMGFCWGVVTSVGIIAANQVGKQQAEITINSIYLGIILHAGIMISIVLGVPVMLIFAFIEKPLLLLGQDPEVVAEAQRYLYGVQCGVIADIARFAIFQLAIAMGRPIMPLIVNILAIPLLILLSNIFIHGYYGMPALGIMGVGVGVGLTNLIAFLVMTIYCVSFEPFKSHLLRLWSWLDYKNMMHRQLVLGVPIGALFNIEVGFFGAIALLMGIISVDAQAAHQITMQWLLITIIATFAVGEAVTILISRAHGSKQIHLAKGYTVAGVTITLTAITVVACFYWFFPQIIIGVDLDVTNPENKNIVSLVTKILIICGFFQIFDAVRIVIVAALRGMRDTQYPMWFSIISFWVVGFPLVLILAFYLDMQAMGIWYGILVVVVINTLLLFLRVREKLSYECA
jgi:MATE family multidrug resistance protein